MIRPALPEDAQGICSVYNHYVLNSPATFETAEVSIDEMRQRISRVTENYPWLVFDAGGSVAGYAYATRWKDRKAYDLSAECAVYVSEKFQRKGIATELYASLISECRKRKLHLLIAGITLPNVASIAMHEKSGFRYIGKFPEVGWKFGGWIDVGYWVLTLD